MIFEILDVTDLKMMSMVSIALYSKDLNMSLRKHRF